MKVREAVGPVQVLPPGLLNMLQLKTGGQSPDAMRQDIQPSIDLEAWWLRATRQKVSAAYNISAAVAGYLTVVLPLNVSGATLGPDNRTWWYVHDASVVGNLGAASSATGLQPAFEEDGGPFNNTLNYTTVGAGARLVSIAAGNGETSVIMGAHGFWMPPGSRFGCYIDQVFGASITIEVAGFSYSALPI